MNKQIIHFGQDLDKEEFYNLILKVTDIGSGKLSEEIKDGLLQRGFIVNRQKLSDLIRIWLNDAVGIRLLLNLLFYNRTHS